MKCVKHMYRKESLINIAEIVSHKFHVIGGCGLSVAGLGSHLMGAVSILAALFYSIMITF